MGRTGTYVRRKTSQNRYKRRKTTVGYAVLRQADGANALGKDREIRQVRQSYQNSLLFILLENQPADVLIRSFQCIERDSVSNAACTGCLAFTDRLLLGLQLSAVVRKYVFYPGSSVASF